MENKVPVTYDEFVQHESHEIRAAYKQRNGYDSLNESDLAHCNWRRLVELWTHRDIIHDILNEPLEDGGPGGAYVPGRVLQQITLSDKHFLVGGKITRLRGFSAFPLVDRILRQGTAKSTQWRAWLEPWVERAYNYTRVWVYTNPDYWGENAWGVPPVSEFRDAVKLLGEEYGLIVEVTLTTDNQIGSYGLVEKFSPSFDDLPHTLVELINEAGVHQEGKLDPVEVVKYYHGKRPWTNGMYVDTKKVYGTYGVAHDERNEEWPRKPKDQLERWRGGGPNDPSDPPYHMPWICDEEAKLEDVRWTWADWEAYFGVMSQMSGGGVVHSNAGKLLRDLNPDEQKLRDVAITAMKYFPDDTFEPSAYFHNQDDEKAHGCLRTYEMKNTRVRVRPTDNAAILSFR